MKECSKCGICLELSDFSSVDKKGFYLRGVCKKCRSAQITKERREVKKQIIAYMGGKCAHCGLVDTPEVYDLHHLDPSKKEIGIARLIRNGGKFETFLRELAKCILLCSNCHRKVHASLDA